MTEPAPAIRTLIFDTETTGLLQPKIAPLIDQPSIIEFAGVVIDENLQIVEEVEFLCDPGFKISAEITKITGIKQEQLVGQKPFSEYADQIISLFSGCDEVVAHNLKFDYGMIDNELKRLGKDEELKWPKKICTVEKSYIIKGRRMKLTELHEHLFGIPFDGAHRAMVDVKALARCFVELRKRGML